MLVRKEALVIVMDVLATRLFDRLQRGRRLRCTTRQLLLRLIARRRILAININASLEIGYCERGHTHPEDLGSACPPMPSQAPCCPT